MNSDFNRPAGLSSLGNLAYDTIMKFLKRHDLVDSGGCKVFYSPQEWKARGEKYGLNSHLIIVFDGGDHRSCFANDDGWQLSEKMYNELRNVGVYAEPCTGWYAAVYRN